MHSRQAVKLIASKVVFGITLTGVSVAAGAQTFDAGADPVFQKMLGVNRGLTSYKAHLDVATRLPLGSFTLHGTVYQRGEHSKVVFDNVPAIAKSSVENQPSIGPASVWRSQYAITVSSRTADATTYHLVPLASGGVRSIDAVVQNASGLVQRYVWLKTNGMTITSDQTYGFVDGYELVHTTSTETRGGGVHADSQTTFTDYQVNLSLPDSLFATP
jgi:outer membrane lipoprotein-sorting protein